MPSDPSAALSSLLRAADIHDHEEIIKAANAALKLDRDDLPAAQTKVVALLKLDRFDDALRLLDSHGETLQAACVVEKAYALYKAGKLDDATALLRATDTAEATDVRSAKERSLRHIAAQVAYRAGRFDEAGMIYGEMLRAEAAGEESDLKINATAAAAQAEWNSSFQQSGNFKGLDLGETAETFEACYNLASGAIARGGLGHAANLLQRAAMLCDNSDELDEEEKRAELRPIRAQQAFVLAKMGRRDEALEVLQSLAPFTESDGKDFEAVALNNLLALEPPANPFLLHRQNEALLASLPAAKLFSHQSSTISSNALVIDLAAKKINGVRSRTGTILSQAQLPTTAPGITAAAVLNAAAETEGCEPAEALRKLGLLAAKRPRDVGLALTIVQMQIKQNALGSALSTLEAFLGRLEDEDSEEEEEVVVDRDVRYSPGLVALAVSLYRSQGRESSAKNELTKAAKYWTARPESATSTSESVESLLLAAGVQLMRSSSKDDLALAGSSFERTRSSTLSSSGLVASYAAIDERKAAPYAAQARLPPVEQLVTGVDIPALFAAGVVTLGRATPSIGVVSKKRPAEGQAQGQGQDAAQGKTKRRRKLPKGYVEGKTPDPERWLPLRDRSSYRPKGRKGKKRADMTQGGVVKEEEVLDLVGGGGVKVEKAGGGAGKKKKKGKK